MTPAQLLARIRKRSLPPAALLLGPEAYERRRLKEALLATVPENAVTQHDLTEQSLAEVVDDARALSLFTTERLIWVVNAEAALPRGRAAEEGHEEDSAGGASAAGAAPLAAYLKDPSPGVTLIFEAMRFDFEGDDKRKQERVRKFYASVQEVVELRRFGPREARQETDTLALRAGFRLDPAAADLLVEALGADIARIAVEIEKLSLYAGNRVVGVDDIGALVPDARSTTIFALVGALGRRDRAQVAGDSGHAGARRRVLAAGAGVPLHAVPHGAGGARGRPEECPADSGILSASGGGDVAVARRTDPADRRQIRVAATGARHQADLRGGPGTPRRAAG